MKIVRRLDLKRSVKERLSKILIFFDKLYLISNLSDFSRWADTNAMPRPTGAAADRRFRSFLYNFYSKGLWEIPPRVKSNLLFMISNDSLEIKVETVMIHDREPPLDVP